MKLYLLFLLILTGCVKPIYTPNPQNKIQEYVHLDPEFSGFEQRIVQRSVSEWSETTHKFITWNFQDWPIYDFSSPLFPFTDGPNCTKHLLVMRMISINKAIIDIETSINSPIAGYANLNSEKCGTETIFLVMDRIRSLDELRLVTLHEIGHILGLKHDVNNSIMEPKGFHAKCITHRDFINFCKLWNCNPDEFESCR